MTTPKNFGVEESYDSGELIVIAPSGERLIQKSSVLKLIGPLEASSKKVSIKAIQGTNNQMFFEFYVLSEGSYNLISDWGETSIQIKSRNDLNFHQEFGIFSIVVVALVSLMAWKYVRRKA